MKKFIKIISFAMVLMLSIPMFSFIGGISTAHAEVSNVDENLPIRLHLIFKDNVDGRRIKNVAITGKYSSRTCDKNGNVVSSELGITPFGDTSIGQEALKSNSNGEIIYDISDYGGLFHNSKGTYNEISVSFKATAPTPYFVRTEKFTYNLSYKNCKEVKDANGKTIAYELYKVLKFDFNETSYPGRVVLTFKTQDGKPVQDVGISGNYGHHICNKDGKTTITTRGLTLLEDENGGPLYYSDSKGVVTIPITGFGDIYRKADGSYSVISFGPQFVYPHGQEFASTSAKYDEISFKNCRIVTDKNGKKWYEFKATITLNGTSLTEYSNPLKLNVIYKDQNGKAVNGIKTLASVYGERSVFTHGLFRGTESGGAALPYSKDVVKKTGLANNSNGVVSFNFEENLFYTNWDDYNVLSIMIGYVAPDKYDVEYGTMTIGNDSYEMAGKSSAAVKASDCKSEDGKWVYTVTITLKEKTQNTSKPTNTPKPTATPKPTSKPTEKPTTKPTTKPTASQTQKPTEAVTQAPTQTPVPETTEVPTPEITPVPTEVPTEAPVETTQEPTVQLLETTVSVKAVCENNEISGVKIEIENEDNIIVYSGSANIEIKLLPGFYTVREISSSAEYEAVYKEYTFVLKNGETEHKEVDLKYFTTQAEPTAEAQQTDTPDTKGTEDTKDDEPARESGNKSQLIWTCIACAVILIALAGITIVMKKK